MRKRFRIVLVILLAAFLGGVAWEVLRESEPVYKGKPLSYWVNSLGNGEGDMVKGNWRGLGSNAVPILVLALGKRDGIDRDLYEKAWPHLPAWARRRLSRPVQAVVLRENAIDMLNALSMDAKPAIPALIRILKRDKHEALRAKAVWCLENIGKQDRTVTQAFIAALNDQSWNVRLIATNALREVDPAMAAKVFAEGPKKR
ncbi:MAG: domain containing protein [Pedosphaera sp.]|nr:domain containing protein [Pedosphaera sp.]